MQRWPYKLDASVVRVSSLDDDSPDREYWWSKTPEERLNAVEFMRQVVFDYGFAYRTNSKTC